MFLVFYTVLAGFVYHTNSFNIKRENVVPNVNDIPQKNNNITTNNHYNSNIIDNSKKTLNLKSYIFERMLSNEMFSIQQEKNDVPTTVYMSFKNNVVTPTLEMKQRWPIDKVTSKINVQQTFENTSYNLSTYYFEKSFTSGKKRNDNNLNFLVSTKNKVIEVRSFSSMPYRKSESLSLVQQEKRQCSCMRNNANTICSHRVFDAGQVSTEKICTHTENHLMIEPECTRTSAVSSISLTYFPYIYAYPSYFVGITTVPFDSYYQSDIENNLKLPKRKKHKKNKKPHLDEEIILESEENYYEKVKDDNDLYEYRETDKQISKKYNNIKYVDSAMDDYDLPKKKNNNENGNVIDRDSFIEHIIEDIKLYYKDALIKDCYCSVASSSFRSNRQLYPITTLLIFIVLCN